MKLLISLKQSDRYGNVLTVIADKVTLDTGAIDWVLYPMLQSDAVCLKVKAAGESGRIRYEMVNTIEAFDPFPSRN